MNVFILADLRETSNFRSAVFQSFLKLPKWLQPNNAGVIVLQGKRITSLGTGKKSDLVSFFTNVSCASLWHLRGLIKACSARTEVPEWTHKYEAHLWETELLWFPNGSKCREQDHSFNYHSLIPSATKILSLVWEWSTWKCEWFL